MKTQLTTCGFLAFALISPVGGIQAQITTDPWMPFRYLVGVWEGVGEGFGAESNVRHHWQFVIENKFIRLQTRSIATAEDGSQELHEDVGYLSYDADDRRFVFRQFLSEGYVNTYDVTVGAGDRQSIEFAYRHAESAGGMRARMHLVFVGNNDYEMVLDLANPGEDFVACQLMRMKKVSRE
jgi:hypothetical protein